MSVSWRLKTYLSQKHSIYTPTALKKEITLKTGIIVSLPNICKLINKKPALVSLNMMELLCSTLDCKLSDFFEITPREYKNKYEKKKYSYKNTPLSKRGTQGFPSPKDYS
ncbi:MAG: DNA-binding Xre family transcriptional regulator [Flavobacteriaceae bacterium]|jgi:DNA-binding Xre family transcriptional regulator